MLFKTFRKLLYDTKIQWIRLTNTLQALHNLQQSIHMINRSIQSKKLPIKVVFICHAHETWDALGDIYEVMKDDPLFHPVIVSINRRYPGENGYSTEETVHKYLKSKNIPHIRMNMQNSWEGLDILKSIAPHIIFRQSQWEADYPPAFRTSELTFARLCVVPYAISIIEYFETDGRDNDVGNSYDQYFHRMAWRIFCETAWVKERYLSFAHGEQEKYVLSGYPKLHRLLSQRTDPLWPISNTDGSSRTKIIWAPHHSVQQEWLGFGVFHLIYQDMLKLAKEFSDLFEFVLKPHPALFNMVVSENLISKADIDEFIHQWQSLPNCALLTDGEYGHLFAASDAMITDGISFLIEYPLFDKPMIFFDSCRHVPFNTLGKYAVDCAIVVTTTSEMQNALFNFAAVDSQENLDKKRQFLKKQLFFDDQDPTEIIINEIKKGYLNPVGNGL